MTDQSQSNLYETQRILEEHHVLDANAGVEAATAFEVETLASVLRMVRDGHATTRPDLSRRLGLGRAVVTQRVERLVRAGLLEEVGLARSTGGRQPRQLRFCADSGQILVAELGATSISVGIADFGGTLQRYHEEPADIAEGPEHIFARVEEIWEKLVAPEEQGAPVVGVGVGLPAPVEFANGRPVSPPIMPGWDDYPVRERFSERYQAPVWVDNEVNAMALGELRAGLALGHSNAVVIKLGTGIGAGIVSGGALHRGFDGCAGDLGHVRAFDASTVVCRCGNVGCLEAHAGGAALARAGEAAARDGRSPALARVLAERGAVSARDLSVAASAGDRVANELILEAAQLVGRNLATLVNLLNPEVIIIGGGVSGAGDRLIAVIRQSIYERSLPLATRHLKIVRSQLGDVAGMVGAAHMVIDELFANDRLGRWIDRGTPAGHPELV